MAGECREEIAGKRFLSLGGEAAGRSGNVGEWGWRSGVVRAATHRDVRDDDLQVLVEYDDSEWQRREWLSVHKDGLFQLFMVERGLVWAQREDPFSAARETVLWPALTFSSLVSKLDLPDNLLPVEFLVDRTLAFEDYARLKPYQTWDASLPGLRDYPEVEGAVKRWSELQDGQRILLTTPSVLLGYRVEVYRAEGTTQWYTAVIIGYNEATRDLTVTDDTVLEEHNVDPTLVQMRLIGDGVVESIMRGEEVGITPRRSRSSVFPQNETSNRFVRGSPSGVDSRRYGCRTTAPHPAGINPDTPDKARTRKRNREAFESKEDPENHRIRRLHRHRRRRVEQNKLEDIRSVEDHLRRRDGDGGEAGAALSTREDARRESMPCANAALVKGYSNGSEEEEDCVIVAQTGTNITSNRTVEQGNCSIRGDDDVPLVSSSPSPYVVNRMEIVGGGVVGPLPDGGSSSLASSSGCGLLLRYHPDDRSDSGVSSLRSCISSGDERSGSRSSALSSTDEPTSSSSSSSNNGNDVVVVVAAASASSSATAPAQHALRNRSPLYIPAASSASSIQQRHHEGNEPVRVWRDPNLLLEEPHVRHIHSVQHQTLLMSHSNTPASASAGPPPASSVSSVAGHYPVVPASLMTSHVPLAGHHPHLSAGSHALYHHPTAAQFSDMLWKTGQRAHPSYGVPAHVLAAHQAAGGDEGLAVREHLQDRERQERLYRERQNQEMEKQKEKERIERDKQEREKMEREREKREKEEKESLDQAIHNHFEKSLRAFQSKTWNPIGGKASSQGRTPMMAEDERKRAEDMYHRVHMAAVRDNRDHRAYYAVQRPSNAPTKPDYPPPPAHSRLAVSKSSEKIPAAISLHQQMPKSEPNVYGYPSHQVQNSFFEPKIKSEMHKTQTPGGLVVTKSGPMDRDDRVEMKNSVIVKHEVKNPHHADGQASQRGVSVAHSPGPKLRNDMLGHYQNPGAAAKGMYEYRSAAQSPHHLSHAAPPAGQHHHVVEAQNLGKATAAGGHHRSGGGHAAGPLHQHQRRSPHQHQPAHHSQPDVRYRGGADVYQTAAKANYSFTTAGYTISSAPPPAMVNSKPKVSSPAPHQIFGKPHLVSGGGGGAPPPRDRSSHDTASPIPLTSKPPPPLIGASISPSPFQQVSQYHPPHSQQPAVVGCLPPPAHSQTPSSVMDRFERSKPPVGYVPGGLSVKLVAASPPAAAPRSRYSPNAVQCQPLDLGMGSNNRAQSPKRKGPVDAPAPALCLDAKKRKIEAAVQAQAHAQLARVSEPSPLIASAAATAITTVANTLAYRTEEVGATTTPPPAPPPTGSESQSPPCAVDGEPPGTPGKANANVTDSEKSNSPGPQAKASSSGGSYPVRHLKKAWLQRHTGEDAEDTTGVVGSGTCVTLPLNIKSTTPPTSNSNPGKDGGGNPVNSIHSIGSMAVNSINKIKHFANNKANRKKEIVNGDAKNNDDSSSSDQEKGGGAGGGGRKSPAKRKPPKVKRKKGGGSATKKAVDERKQRKSSSSGGPHQATTTTPAASESGTDSDSVASDKDSDSGASGSTPAARKSSLHQQQQQQQQQHRKRGRKPKGGAGGGGGGGAPSKNDKASGDEPRPKKSKDEPPPPPPQPPRDPFRKPPVGQLKKTGESFLQDGPCFEVAPKLAKCRECRWTPNQRSKNMPNIFCRFYAFRRLRYTKNGQLAIAGFSDPHKDAMEDDIRLWLPNADSPPSDLDLETSRFLLKQVGDHFCDLLVQEKEANAEHLSEDKTVAWKRVVQGVREMCDVCETTLFNFHWACGKCGFVVCIDCYKSRKRGAIKVWGEANKDRDEYSWLLCTNRQVHEQEKLMLTQIIAGDSLNKLGKMVHEMRDLWSIEQFCACPAAKESSPNKNNNQQVRDIVRSILGDKINGAKKEFKDEEDSSSERADIKKEAGGGGGGSSSEDEGNFSTLRELLIRPSHKPNGSRAASPASGPNKTETKKKPGQPTKPADLDDVISSVIEDNVPQKTVETPAEPKNELKHFIRRYNWQGKGRVQLPIRIMTLTESKTLYPNAPHSWLCDGKLLRLSDPSCKENYKIFQDQWKRGQPVIVSDVTRDIDPDLWHPEAFARDFGDDKNDLVNCMTGKVVPNQPMRKFWEGFDHFGKRLKDDRGQPMLLKLKDWPPGEDFAEMLPTRYSDLMKVLPLSEYTHRTGRLNLASRLPECFVRPDLGPKMYNAYGSALHPGKGTTNLHLDISDAVNVMVYVGIPKDADTDEHIKEAFRAIDEAGCDILTRRRVRDKGELPGALWHIYNARDADKIRDLLNKVVVEKGGRLEPHNDPIHDQSCYLDGPLRERLYKEYGVEGYAIVQCKGDAVFIPAGAPHQVRNLHNCIKVAEDFVSPENVSHCFHLTQEFRDLSDTHSNHEDKLQIKNIIYHAVKDALSALSSIINGRLSVKCEKEENCSSSGSVSNGAVGGSGSSNEAEHSAKSDSNEATA